MNLRGGAGRRWAQPFDADWANSALTKYANVHHPERITIVDDPILGASRKVAKFEVFDTDVGPTANPRAQVESPYNLANGQEMWLGFGLLIPDGGIPLPFGGWLSFMQVYGPPFAGSAPWSIGIREGSSELVISRNNDRPIPWRMDVITDTWIDFAIRTRLSTNGLFGELEVWRDIGSGWEQQTLTEDRFATLDASNNGGGNAFDLHLYRLLGVASVATCYFAAHKIGRDLASVDPGSH